MAGYRQLDAAGGSSLRSTLIKLLTIVLCVGTTWAQSATLSTAEHVHQLFKQERWQQIVDLNPPLGISAETDFEHGIALAHVQSWSEARRALQSGLRMQPKDPRFMVELAGVAFKQANYAESEMWLRRALRFSTEDSYTLDFLGTVFYLEGNLDAALKYWNRIGKPKINSIQSEPRPRLNPILFDRAFSFSPASTLELSDLRSTSARLRQLNLFSTFRFDLEAQPDSNFNLTFRGSERNGCAGNSWPCLLVLFGQTPAQTLNFSYFNIARKAVNFTSGYRWDGEKRRVLGQLEFPLATKPNWELQLGTDLRNENWAVRNSFSGPAPLLAALNLKREVGFLRFSDVMSGNWRWFTSTELSNRDYHDVFTGSGLSSQLLTSGFQLKQSLGIESSLFRFPERRLDIDGSATASFARLWSGTSAHYSQLQGTLRLHWFSQHTGEKYELNEQFKAGRAFGDPPFDELFVLGVLGDTDLRMRAHIATRDGKKGSAPLCRNYVVSNFEALRDVSPISLAHIKVGPFVDAGRVGDPLPQLGSAKWLWDAGIETRLQAFGFTVTLSYGRDLRSGRNAWVATSP